MAYGMCRSTNGTLAMWRELVDGGYEIEWGYSDRPGTISIEVMHVVDDGTKLVGSNKDGRLLKALKMKLKRRKEVEDSTVIQEVGTVESDIIDEDDVELPQKVTSPDVLKVLEDIKGQMNE